MVKKALTAKKEKEREEILQEPKRLSKAGEWRRTLPKDFLIIHDMRAAMK